MLAGALRLRDTEWSSWSSLLGWHVRGIWAPNSEGTDIHTVDASRDQTMVVRSPTESPEADCGSLGLHAHTLSPTLSSMPDADVARALQAVGDAFNLVRLFAFPASAPRAPCKAFSGHARCGRPLFSACRAGWRGG